MTREQIQEKFKAAAEAARRGTAGKRRSAEASVKRMVERYSWLRDYARLMSLSDMPGLTREFPWLAPPAKALAKKAVTKTRHVNGRGHVADGAAVSGQRPQTAQSCATEPPAKASAAKTRHTDAPGRADRGVAVSKHGRKTTESCATEPWVKPATEPGFEYRQCYKPNCKCMNGGAWHGPYRYRKQRIGAVVRSEYIGGRVKNNQVG